MKFEQAICPICHEETIVAKQNTECFCIQCGRKISVADALQAISERQAQQSTPGYEHSQASAKIRQAKTAASPSSDNNNANFTIKDGVLLSYHGDSTEVFVPAGTVKIATRAFEGKPITSIIFPPSMESINPEIFQALSTLSSVSYNGTDNKLISSDGVLYLPKKSTLLIYPPDKREPVYTVPDGIHQVHIANNPWLQQVIVPHEMDQLILENCQSLQAVTLAAASTEENSGGQAAGLHTDKEQENSNAERQGWKKLVLDGCPALSNLVVPPHSVEVRLKQLQTLSSITLPDSIRVLKLDDCPMLASCCLSQHSAEQASAADADPTAGNRFPLPDGIISLHIEKCPAISDLDLPGSLHVLIVSGVDGLKRVVIREGLKTLRRKSFSGLPAGCQVHLPDSLREVDFDAFFACESPDFHFPAFAQALVSDTALGAWRGAIWRAQGKCPNCGGALKGIGRKRCVNCGIQ